MTDHDRLMDLIWSGALDKYTPPQIDAMFACWLRNRGHARTDGISTPDEPER